MTTCVLGPGHVLLLVATLSSAAALGCGPRPAPEAGGHTTGAAPGVAGGSEVAATEPEAIPEEPVAACTGGPALEVPETADLVCTDDDLHDCHVEVPVVIRNCGEVPVTTDRVEVTGPAGWEMEVTSEFDVPDVALAPQQAWVWQWKTVGEGTFEVKVRLTGADGEPLERTATITVRNPAREAAVEACRACDGEWFHAMFGVRCNCRTTDAGQACTSRDQCQGPCMFEEWMPIEDDSPLAEDAPPCQEGKRRYVASGTCGERMLVTGCVSVIEEPTYDCRWPRMEHLPRAAPERICSD